MASMQIIQTSKSIQELRFSVIREMGGMAAHMDGVITLGIGEPDFNTPPAITEKAFQDALNGHTHYTPSKGDPELLEKLAANITRETGISTGSSSIIITHGGMGALTASLRTLLEQGDHVLLVEPHFPDYIAHIAFARGVAVKARSRAENRFIPLPQDIELAITTKTRVLILNSPNNPTGAVIPGDVLDAISELAIRYNLFVISDEVYDRIIFDPPFESIVTRPGMAERTLVIKSFSKSHAMTGWRVGYCYGPQAVIDQMLKVVNYSTACASSIGQRAAVAALDIDPSVISAMKDRFEARVDLVCTRLNAMEGIKVARPGGSFYLFADIRPITRKSREFAIRLLQEEKVVVIPGYAFGDSAEGFFRIACTRSKQQLAEAMDRIQAFLTRFREE